MMNKNKFTKVSLKKGEMNVYDFGAVKLHAYKTNDFIDNEVFIIEKNKKAVVIESPCFFDNHRELELYLADHGLHVEGMLLAYHMGGGTFLPKARKYATENADEYGHNGGGRTLINQFADAFGKVFDSCIHRVTDYIGAGPVTIADIQFKINPTEEAFDIEIPEINAVYTHMLGHDCHSIVAGAGHADAVIAQLETYILKGYDLILTSHYTPEDLKDVQTKISYLQNLKNLAAACSDRSGFKSAVLKEYPAYSGENYLDMTAGFFFA